MEMVDGEEQLFDPTHPIWKLLLILTLGLFALGGLGTTDLLVGIV